MCAHFPHRDHSHTPSNSGSCAPVHNSTHTQKRAATAKKKGQLRHTVSDWHVRHAGHVSGDALPSECLSVTFFISQIASVHRRRRRSVPFRTERNSCADSIYRSHVAGGRPVHTISRVFYAKQQPHQQHTKNQHTCGPPEQIDRIRVCFGIFVRRVTFRVEPTNERTERSEAMCFGLCRRSLVVRAC